MTGQELVGKVQDATRAAKAILSPVETHWVREPKKAIVVVLRYLQRRGEEIPLAQCRESQRSYNLFWRVIDAKQPCRFERDHGTGTGKGHLHFGSKVPIAGWHLVVRGRSKIPDSAELLANFPCPSERSAAGWQSGPLELQAPISASLALEYLANGVKIEKT